MMTAPMEEWQVIKDEFESCKVCIRTVIDLLHANTKVATFCRPCYNIIYCLSNQTETQGDLPVDYSFVRPGPACHVCRRKLVHRIALISHQIHPDETTLCFNCKRLILRMNNTDSDVEF